MVYLELTQVILTQVLTICIVQIIGGLAKVLVIQSIETKTIKCQPKRRKRERAQK